MAGIQANSPLRSSHPLILFNKLLSLAAFIVLFAAGWMVLSYLKTGMAGSPSDQQPAQPVTAESAGSAVQVRQSDSPQVERLSAPVKLVYSCSGESENYHTSNHLPSACERSALSEDAALTRGLKPCRICMPER